MKKGKTNPNFWRNHLFLLWRNLLLGHYLTFQATKHNFDENFLFKFLPFGIKWAKSFNALELLRIWRQALQPAAILLGVVRILLTICDFWLVFWRCTRWREIHRNSSVCYNSWVLFSLFWLHKFVNSLSKRVQIVQTTHDGSNQRQASLSSIL